MATPSNIPTEPLSIDDVLPLIGEFGKFQILLEIAFCIMVFPGSMLILIPYFAQHNPPWMCIANSTVCRLNGTYDTQSKFYKERCKMPRSEWQFTKPKEYSIMTQACFKEENWKKFGYPKQWVLRLDDEEAMPSRLAVATFNTD
eukprot:gene1190-15553_t